MDRLFFEEIQSAKQARALWIIIVPACFLMIFPFLYGIYWQIFQGEPWGDHPMSDNELLIVFFVLLIGLAGILWMISLIKLETRIDRHGIQYRFFPNQWRWRTIKKEEIETFEVKNLKSIIRAGGWGFHRNYFTKLKSIMVYGNKVVEVKLKNGERVRLGTQEMDRMTRALQALFSSQ